MHLSAHKSFHSFISFLTNIFSILLILQVGNELGIQDCVTVLDIINLVDGNDREESNKEHHNWEPDGNLSTGENTWVNEVGALLDVLVLWIDSGIRLCVG